MAAPATLITAAELYLAYTQNFVKEMLPNAGKDAPDADRVALVLRSATGHVLGKVQVQLKTTGIDEWWEAPTTTERDKASLKELTLGSAAYYLRLYGQKAGEELPPDVMDAQDRVDRRIDEIAKHLATIASNAQPAATTQNEFRYTSGAGNYPAGSPRSRWSNF